MTLAYASKLGFTVRKVDVGTQKIDESALTMHGMVIASFQVKDKERRVCCFQETFLVIDTSMEVVPKMLFLTLSNADMAFAERKLTRRSYTAAEAYPTTNRLL